MAALPLWSTRGYVQRGQSLFRPLRRYASHIQGCGRLWVAALVFLAVSMMSTMATALPLRVLFETDADVTSNELAINTYPTYGDFFADTNSSSQFSTINVNSPFIARGITYDGTAYRVLFETRADATSNELAINSYPTLTDLLNDTNSTSQFSVININSPFSVGGFAYDSSGYHVLFETDADVTSNELAINTYPTLTDLLNDTNGTSTFSDINVNSPFSVAGFLIEPEVSGGPGAIDEPPPVFLFAFGLAILGLTSRLRATRSRPASA